jgi:hypothetical protein
MLRPRLIDGQDPHFVSLAGYLTPSAGFSSNKRQPTACPMVSEISMGGGGLAREKGISNNYPFLSNLERGW